MFSFAIQRLNRQANCIGSRQAQKSAVGPELLPNEILRSIGCCALRDLGGMAWGTRIGTFFIPYNFFTELFTAASTFLPDYKVHNKNRKFKSS